MSKMVALQRQNPSPGSGSGSGSLPRPAPLLSLHRELNVTLCVREKLLCHFVINANFILIEEFGFDILKIHFNKKQWCQFTNPLFSAFIQIFKIIHWSNSIY